MQRTSAIAVAWLGVASLVAGVTAPLAVGSWNWIMVSWLFIGPGPFVAAGLYALWRRPGNVAGHFLIGAATLIFALPFGLENVVLARVSAVGVESWMWIPVASSLIAALAGVVLLTMLCAVLPDGQADSANRARRMRWMWWTLLIGPLLLMTNEHTYHRAIEFDGVSVASPFFIGALEPLGELSVILFESHGVLLLWGMWVLYRRFTTSDTRDRRRIRWILYGFATMIVVGLGTYSLGVLGAMPVLSHGPLLSLLSIPMAAGPLAIGAAIVEPEWIQRDTIARKSLVYSALSILILLVWVMTASAFGIAADDRLGGDLAVIVAVVGAIAFQPARRRLMALADRSVYGERPSAFEAIAGIGDTAEEDPGLLLPRLADTLAAALRLRWARVVVGASVVAVGEVSGDPELSLPLRNGDDVLGLVECGRKIDGPFTDEDVQLVRTLVSQAALAISNARLATRIVTAQETERRRIERNIHDGVQQELVALIARLGIARSEARQERLAPEAIIDLQEEARRILTDLRELAQGIHPSVLTDGGLVEAVEERCAALPIDVRLSVEPALRTTRFSDDTEGAAYFFVTECLTNVLKHSDASAVRVRLGLDEGLALEVADDGGGFDPTRTTRRGLRGLSDRLTALGGQLSVESAPGTGTTVRAMLPADPR